MSSCYAVVLNGNTEIKYFRSTTHVALTMLKLWRMSGAIRRSTLLGGRVFSLPLARSSPKVVFQLPSGAVVECDLDDVDINPRACADLDYHLCAFGFNRGLDSLR